MEWSGGTSNLYHPTGRERRGLKSAQKGWGWGWGSLFPSRVDSREGGIRPTRSDASARTENYVEAICSGYRNDRATAHDS